MLKGLLYKDLYLIRNSILIGMGIILGASVFAIIIVLGITSGNFKSILEETDIFNLIFKGFVIFVAGTGIYTALCSASAIEMDEKSEWFKVLYSSPVTIIQEIMSRYLLAFTVNTIMTVWSSVNIPFIYLAGGKSYGLDELKLIACCWLLGMLSIFIRLPIDIIFPAKASTSISIGIISTMLIGLMVWVFIAGNDVVIACIAEGIRFVCRHGVVLIAVTVSLSFALSYFGKKNRRCA